MGVPLGYVPCSGHLLVTFRLVTRGDSRGRDQGVWLTHGAGVRMHDGVWGFNYKKISTRVSTYKKEKIGG